MLQVTPRLMQLAGMLVSLAAFGYAAWLFLWVKKQPQENATITRVGKLIQNGARAFLGRQYKLLIAFAGLVSAVIFLLLPAPIWQGGSVGKNLTMAVCYLAGTVFSAFAGKIGIEVATIANGRSAEAAQKGLRPSFMVGFRGGAVMGMAVVGACVLGISLVNMLVADTTAVLCFSFGASSLALFAKVGGGIFTKTADIAADLTGKVELGIPEDDPRNPAVIA
ncbi:MAG: sodium/proton-translocating pyrophosphatase, partial [Oscillospiraceae bacterium]|nr:sodium/proton-translocating pyrophosphatase [Oscillospiraceae bacterium]